MAASKPRTPRSLTEFGTHLFVSCLRARDTKLSSVSNNWTTKPFPRGVPNHSLVNRRIVLLRRCCPRSFEPLLRTTLSRIFESLYSKALLEILESVYSTKRFVSDEYASLLLLVVIVIVVVVVVVVTASSILLLLHYDSHWLCLSTKISWQGGWREPPQLVRAVRYHLTSVHSSQD